MIFSITTIPVSNVTKRQREGVRNYALTGHITNPEISKNKNLYYDVKVQVTKTEYTTIRFMAKGGCPHAEKLRLIKKEEEVKGNRVIFLQKIFKSDDTSFFNMELGSKYIFQNIFPFRPTSLTTSINEIRNHTSGRFHVSACIKWIFLKFKMECLLMSQTK